MPNSSLRLPPPGVPLRPSCWPPCPPAGRHARPCAGDGRGPLRRQQLHHRPIFPRRPLQTPRMSPDENYGPQAAHAPIHEAIPSRDPGHLARKSRRGRAPYRALEIASRHAAPVSLRARAPPIIAQPKMGRRRPSGDEHRGRCPKSRGGRRPVFCKYATLLEQRLHAANPASASTSTKRAARPISPTANAPVPRGGTPHHHGRRCPRGCEEEFNADGHSWASARAGDAWLNAIASGIARPIPTPASPSGGLMISGAPTTTTPAPAAPTSPLLPFSRDYRARSPHASAPRKRWRTISAFATVAGRSRPPP